MTFRYVGQNGEYFLGIPKRDLTSDDFADLSPANQAIVLGSTIYQQVADEAAPRKKAEQPAQAPVSG